MPLRWSWAILAVAMAAGPAWALEPGEVAVVANFASEESIALAQYYLEARQIPQANLVMVQTTCEYEISRDEYEKQIRRPLMSVLQQRGLAGKIKCVCLMWGVPVRVAGPAATTQCASVPALGPCDASVDSELSLLWWGDYNLQGPLANPLHWSHDAQCDANRPVTLMTARIDGPSRDDCVRVIKSSLWAETNGLRGTFYIDMGGPQRAYDDLLFRLHQTVKDQTTLPVELDTRDEPFAPRHCPQAALYVGWYSPRQYVPSFVWATGAIGWHISGFEAQHLRSSSSREWCPQMIRHGAAATLGAVNEPTLGGLPLPTEFFPLLLTGRYTIAECYWRTIPHVSWRMTLIADPLYNPFAKNPQLSFDKLPPGLAPKETPKESETASRPGVLPAAESRPAASGPAGGETPASSASVSHFIPASVPADACRGPSGPAAASEMGLLNKTSPPASQAGTTAPSVQFDLVTKRPAAATPSPSPDANHP